MASRKNGLPEELLSQARHQIKMYKKTRNEKHLRKACEKGRRASVQAVFRELGRKPRSHRDSLQGFATLGKQRNDEFIMIMGVTADGLHSLSYPSELPVGLVEGGLKDVERLITLLSRKGKK